MVAFNFKKTFVRRIENRSKTGTIRQTQRCQPGAAMQLYTGQRTKHCRRVGTATCQHVIPLRIHKNRIEFLSGQMHSLRDAAELEAFAHDDGFDSWAEMVAFFEKEYSLPAAAYLHVWGDTFVKAAA